MAKKKNEEEVVDSESTTSKTIVLEKDYRIDAGNAAGRYSLFIKKIINKGTDKEKEGWEVIGYDFHMDTLLSKLAAVITNKAIGDDVVDLKTFLTEYKKSIKYLSELIKL
jgi:hypothetical protein